MDLQNIARLADVQETDMQTTDEKISKFEHFIKDYEALEKRLDSLADSVTHDVMVPFGSLAFMHGQLIHTNEILVLLGDDWFAERSTKQCIEMIHRRIDVLKSQLDGFRKQKYLLESHRKFTKDVEDVLSRKTDVVEINEPYDEENEARWREEHSKSKQTQRQKGGGRSRGRDEDEELLWKRLEELEREEEESGETAEAVTAVSAEGRSCQEPPPVCKVTEPEKTSLGKTVTWGDEVKAKRSEERDSDDSDDSDELCVTRTINFKHTPVSTLTDFSPTEEGTIFRSPADIYKMFSQLSNVTTATKSILKKCSSFEKASVPVVERGADVLSGDQMSSIAADAGESEQIRIKELESVSSEVVERDVEVVQPAVVVAEEGSVATDRKKVSKFKMSRKH